MEQNLSPKTSVDTRQYMQKLQCQKISNKIFLKQNNVRVGQETQLIELANPGHY